MSSRQWAMKFQQYPPGFNPGSLTVLCGPCYSKKEKNAMANKKATWDRDNIQFPRMLAELNAAGLTTHQYRILEDSMDLQQSDIDELLDRAEKRWTYLKSKMMRKP